LMNNLPTVQQVLEVANHAAPFAYAESWDNVGLMVGDPGSEVRGILAGLDPTTDLLEEALQQNANLILTHHPLFFKPLRSLRTDHPDGTLLKQALAHDLHIVACHTNLDVIAGGVSDALARSLGLEEITVLTVTIEESGISQAPAPAGFGRIGRLATTLSGQEFLKTLIKNLSLATLSVAGPLPGRIERVAVCGGSGSDLAAAAFEQGADVYVTGEVKHSVARWAEAMGFCIVDCGHFATENLAVPVLADLMREGLKARGFHLPVWTSSNQQNPFTLYAAPRGVRFIE